jgi:gliding motility-associated-like protein
MRIINLRRLFTLIFYLISLRGQLNAQSFYPPVGIAVQTAPGVYNLSPASACNGTLRGGAIWCTTTLDFNMSFELKYKESFDTVSNGGADGIATVFGENITPASLNGGGGFLGYYDSILTAPNPNFQRSFALECDIYPNSYFNDPVSPYFDHLMIARDGNYNNVVTGGTAVQADPANASIKTGVLHDYKIEWNCLSKILKVYFDNTVRITSNFDYQTIFTNPANVKWGFTAAIAGSCSNQIVRDVQLIITDSFCSPDVITITDTLVGCRMVLFSASHKHANHVNNTWNFGDGNTATGDSVKHLYALPGTYKITVLNSNGDTSSTLVTIMPDPVIAASDDTAICKGDSMRLSATGAIKYSWWPDVALNNVNIQQPIATPSVSTTYIVTGTDQYLCTGIDSVEITVLPSLDLAIIPGGSNIDCKHNSMQLFATGAKEYIWKPKEYCNDPTSSQPIVSPPVTTNFVVQGKDENGCYGYDSIMVKNENQPVVFMPDAFSPNGDGLNDVIYPIVYCGLIFEHFTVYNRWGQQVFSTSIYGQGWNGKYKNVLQEIGSYYYYVTGNAEATGKKMIYKGDFTLVK